MNPEEINIVQSTWKQVLPIRDQAADLFYGRLFEQNPELRQLFPVEMGEQKRKLMMMLNTAVNGLNDVDSLVPALRELGERHVDYGVRPEYYPMVGAALLWTLKQGLGEAFTDEVKSAWTHVYAVLSATMQQAARDSAA